ncbi:hypothetical protein P0082_05405 [Candidatus Haliotispira prima]|uniref:Uncharacterized protein n=1 Tax=Candidatus Haliotispira prima TaxID=3034016 RepID=A0ABY8MJZ0_9SPIO|nr:hypothetical protein P0082_05405 [Candidatus Haliotispira prima]
MDRKPGFGHPNWDELERQTVLRHNVGKNGRVQSSPIENLHDQLQHRAFHVSVAGMHRGELAEEQPIGFVADSYDKGNRMVEFPKYINNNIFSIVSFS